MFIEFKMFEMFKERNPSDFLNNSNPSNILQLASV
jgi:hypothetical protein